jgi:hypothetical protein
MLKRSLLSDPFKERAFGSAVLQSPQKTEDEKISGRFPYALAELLKPYRLQESPQVDLVPIIEKEFEHIQERQAQVKGATLDGAIVYLRELPDDRLEDFPNLFLASAFINRQRGEN